MGMQYYSFCELELNIENMKKIKDFNETFERIQEIFKKEDIDPYEYLEIFYNGAKNKNYIYITLLNLSNKLISIAKKEKNINIYPQYISFEAEGTNKNGEIIWCIELELPEKIINNMKTWTTWCIYG
jgi:hypothetical protein